MEWLTYARYYVNFWNKIENKTEKVSALIELKIYWLTEINK